MSAVNLGLGITYSNTGVNIGNDPEVSLKDINDDTAGKTEIEKVVNLIVKNSSFMSGWSSSLKTYLVKQLENDDRLVEDGNIKPEELAIIVGNLREIFEGFKATYSWGKISLEKSAGKNTLRLNIQQTDKANRPKFIELLELMGYHSGAIEKLIGSDKGPLDEKQLKRVEAVMDPNNCKVLFNKNDKEPFLSVELRHPTNSSKLLEMQFKNERSAGAFLAQKYGLNIKQIREIDLALNDKDDILNKTELTELERLVSGKNVAAPVPSGSKTVLTAEKALAAVISFLGKDGEALSEKVLEFVGDSTNLANLKAVNDKDNDAAIANLQKLISSLDSLTKSDRKTVISAKDKAQVLAALKAKIGKDGFQKILGGNDLAKSDGISELGFNTYLDKGTVDASVSFSELLGFMDRLNTIMGVYRLIPGNSSKGFNDLVADCLSAVNVIHFSENPSPKAVLNALKANGLSDSNDSSFVKNAGDEFLANIKKGSIDWSDDSSIITAFDGDVLALSDKGLTIKGLTEKKIVRFASFKSFCEANKELFESNDDNLIRDTFYQWLEIIVQYENLEDHKKSTAAVAAGTFTDKSASGADHASRVDKLAASKEGKPAVTNLMKKLTVQENSKGISGEQFFTDAKLPAKPSGVDKGSKLYAYIDKGGGNLANFQEVKAGDVLKNFITGEYEVSFMWGSFDAKTFTADKAVEPVTMTLTVTARPAKDDYPGIKEKVAAVASDEGVAVTEFFNGGNIHSKPEGVDAKNKLYAYTLTPDRKSFVLSPVEIKDGAVLPLKAGNHRVSFQWGEIEREIFTPAKKPIVVDLEITAGPAELSDIKARGVIPHTKTGRKLVEFLELGGRKIPEGLEVSLDGKRFVPFTDQILLDQIAFIDGETHKKLTFKLGTEEHVVEFLVLSKVDEGRAKKILDATLKGPILEEKDKGKLGKLLDRQTIGGNFVQISNLKYEGQRGNLKGKTYGEIRKLLIDFIAADSADKNFYQWVNSSK